MKLNIITPSFNQLDHLKRCVASVADQIEAVSYEPIAKSGISVHHHIQDALSADGTVDWLERYAQDVRSQQSEVSSDLCPAYTFSYLSERDAGMYDALNRGIQRVLGSKPIANSLQPIADVEQATPNCQPPTSNRHDSIVAWLNCDEQYLPGTLEFVADYFEKHPDVDILCGGVLLVGDGGGLLAYRKAYAPRKAYIEASHLYTLSCATFYRQRVFDAVGNFDVSFKAAADEEFFLRALRAGFRAKPVSRYCSTFTLSANNLGAGELADREHLEMKARASRWVLAAKPVINLFRRCEKWMSGAYAHKFPLEYSIYAKDLNERTSFVAESATWRWPREREV